MGLRLKLEESELYYFDAVAAERPIKFIEKHLFHYEQEGEPKPFLLLDWQKDITRDLFGWKRRADDLRRFRELYLEIAKGNGKSPYITALGLYFFFAMPGNAKEIYSCAATHAQAKITFTAATNYIKASPSFYNADADTFIEGLAVNKLAITYGSSKWETISGIPKGRSGFRPSVVIGDELHEWGDRTVYDFVRKNVTKRDEALMLIATNSGARRDSLVWEQHERALKVLEGESRDDTLYPIIYAADKECAVDDVEQIKKANPGLGTTIRLENLLGEAALAKASKREESLYRRLNLSQWIQGADKWLDMAKWDSCTRKEGEPLPEKLSALPLYLGLDLSVSDDFSSLAGIWVGKKNMYVKVWTWAPRKRAFQLEDSEGLPITSWVTDGYLHLTEGETVDKETRKRIKRLIVKLSKKYDLQMMGYDRGRVATSYNMIPILEKAEIKVTDIDGKIMGVTAGAQELERRIKEGTIVLPNNPCLRWQAANVEVYADSNGNIRPIKEHAKGRYSGRKGSKIDSIMAIVLAMVEAMRHGIATEENALANWDGAIKFI